MVWLLQTTARNCICTVTDYFQNRSFLVRAHDIPRLVLPGILHIRDFIFEL